MLKRLRIVLAGIFFTGITLLFLDITGTLHTFLGWMAKVQFLPAVFAMNLGVIVSMAVLTLIFGRVYCSVICPLGIMQDIISWARGKSSKKHRFRFSYSPAKNLLRFSVLAIFILLLIIGAHSVAMIIAPYSAYGRIAGNLLAPIYRCGNNALAWIAERIGSYAFYSTEVWVKSLPTIVVAALTFIIIFILAWKGGRTWCNTICPVGTVLGVLSRYSLFAPVIDNTKCRDCGLCGKQCKSSCIDMKEHRIDYSRCVSCMDCIDNCKEGAIRYESRLRLKKAGKNDASQVNGRRSFIISSAVAMTAAASAKAQVKVDGGLAEISHADKPERNTPLVPAGAGSLKNFTSRCTACQLCVSACPNHVLRPATSLDRFMQPEMGYEKGYCRPECTLCSEICPAGAILPVSIEEKSSIQIGIAKVNLDNCIVNTDNVSCGNCARHCPAHAVRMVLKNPEDENSLKIPTVNEQKCIGCGACENLCPARPFTAIHVEGITIHKTK